jgi:NADH-quinone oxidoreductase subunit C
LNREKLQQKLLDDLKGQFGDKLFEAKIDYGMPVVVIDESIHHDIVAWLKDSGEWEFNHFIDITSVDYYKTREKRFEVVVHLRSHKHNLKVRIKTPLADTGDESSLPKLPTLTDLFIGASWTEREVFDLMGIEFEGHPRMTRILSPDDFEGHPLRKDFPVKGRHRGSFPKGTVISNKRREPVAARTTKAKPADQILPNTPWEQKRVPMTNSGNDTAPAGEGDDA